MIIMQENGKLKKGIYKESQYTTQYPFAIASRFQRKYKSLKDDIKVSPYNTTFEKLPF